jgi:hypothetical protein
MRSKGQDTSDRLTQLAALITCDAFFFFEQTLRRTPEISLTGFRQSVERMRSGYASPLTFGTFFDAAHRDGARFYRQLRFDDACGCFKYTSGNKPMP